jgi:hypothetical protein
MASRDVANMTHLVTSSTRYQLVVAFAVFQGTSSGGRQFLRNNRSNRHIVPLYGKSDRLSTKVSNSRRFDRHSRYPGNLRRPYAEGFCAGFRVQDPATCPMTFANDTAKCDFDYGAWVRRCRVTLTIQR